MQQIFSEFTGIKSGDQDTFTGSGDVKYHLGTSYDRPTITGKRVHLSLLANPSHLEVCHTLLGYCYCFFGYQMAAAPSDLVHTGTDFPTGLMTC